MEKPGDEQLIQVKKNKLSAHLPFITQMLNKVRGTNLEQKWQLMNDYILSDKRMMTLEQINKIEATIKKVKDEQAKAMLETNSEDEIESDERTTSKPIQKTNVPKPSDLGKPVLSVGDIQALLDEIGEAPEEVEKPEVKIKTIKVELPIKVDRSAPKQQSSIKPPMVRLPSSWIPSKLTPPSTAKKETLSFLPSQSPLKTYFKIPKLSSSPSSAEDKKPETSPKLKSIDIFKPMKDHLVNPKKWPVKSPDEKKNVELKAEKPVEKVVEEVLETKTEKVPEVVKVKEPEEYLAEMEKSPEKVESPEKSPEKEEKSLKKEDPDEKKSVSFDESPKSRKKLTDPVERTTKELRRLHENIVKDAVPLPTRRSCTLKRSMSMYHDSPPDIDDDKEEKQPKRVKADEDDDKPLVVTRRSVPATSPATTSKAKKIPEEPQVEPPKISTRSRRKSVHSSVFTPEIVPAVVPAKKIKTDPKPDSLEEQFDLKPCAVNLPEVTEDELKKSPKKQNQIAKKSSSRNGGITGRGIRMRSVACGRDKDGNFVCTYRTVTEDGEVIEYRDGHEKKPKKEPKKEKFVEKIEEIEIMKKAKEEKEPKEEKKPEVTKNPPDFLKISNIGLIHSQKGAIFKCFINDCKFQTVEQHSFVKHVETRHKSSTWNGSCGICDKIVLKSKNNEGHSLMNEFIHMIGEHLFNQPSSEEKLPEIEDTEHDTDSLPSPCPEIDQELITGIDSILNELMPNSSDEKLVKKPSMTEPQTSSIIPIQQAPVVSPTTEQSKIISKNIVGRVIPLSKLQGKILSNAIILPKGSVKLPENLVSQEITSPVPLTATSTISPAPTTTQDSPPEKMVKYVIKKPLDGSESSGKPAMKVTPTVQQAEKSSEPKLVSLSSQNRSTNLIVRHVEGASNFSGVICPWMKRRTGKNIQTINLMVSKVALTALYKCMGTTCSFYTSDSEIFLRHLRVHLKLTPSDKENFMTCAYCSFECEDTPEDLIEHVKKAHGFDKFQCAFCFYRSCVDFNVLTHQNNFHKTKARVILELDNKMVRDYHEELKAVKKKRAEFVPPIVCVFCRAVFYVFKTFLNHINEHTNSLNTKCIKCGERTTKGTLHRHLVQCHGFGLFQCVYCRFGTNTFEIISSHIANEHPSRLPLFCERSEYKSAKDMSPQKPLQSSIEATCLKHINQRVSIQFIQKAPRDEKLLRNIENRDNVGLENNAIDEVQLQPKIHVVKTKDLVGMKSTQILTAVRKNPQPDRSLLRRSDGPTIIDISGESSHKIAPSRSSNWPQPKNKTVASTATPFRRNSIAVVPKQARTAMLNMQAKIVMHKLSDKEKATSKPTSSPRKSELKPLGLQIQDVFSLSDRPMTRFRAPE